MPGRVGQYSQPRLVPPSIPIRGHGLETGAGVSINYRPGLVESAQGLLADRHTVIAVVESLSVWDSYRHARATDIVDLRAWPLGVEYGILALNLYYLSKKRAMP